MLDRLRLTPATFALIAIICVALLLRFASYDHPLGYNGGDGMRDYLLAAHAIEYRELPLIYPTNGTLHLLGNSPLTLYVVLLFSSIYNSVWFVNVCFILLGSSAIVGIFFAMRRLFGDWAAIIAASLFAFSPLFITEASYFLWQPYLMEPVLIFGIFLFAKGYRESSVQYLTASLVVTLCACALHMAVLGMLPLYLILLYAAIYRLRGLKGLLAPSAIGLGLLLVLYAPVIFLGSHGPAPESAAAFWTTITKALDPHTFLIECAHAARMLAYRFNLLQPLAGALLAFMGSIYFVRTDITTEKKRMLFILLLFVIQQILAAALTGQGYSDRFIIPADWAFAGAIGTIIYESVMRPKYLRPFGIVLCVLFIWHTVATPVVAAAINNIPHFARPRTTAFDEATAAVEHEIEDLRISNGYTNYHFFDFQGLRSGNYNVLSEVFLVPLEHDLHTQFIHFNSSPRGYHYLKGDQYIFVFCTQGMDDALYMPFMCRNYFASNNPSYTITKTVYDRFPLITVYLATNRALLTH